MADYSLKGAIETLLFVAKEHLSIKELSKLTDNSEKDIIEAISQLKEEYQIRYLQIIDIANGYQIATREEYAGFIERLVNSPIEITLTPASMETLAIVAYRQPISRVEVENIRGVN